MRKTVLTVAMFAVLACVAKTSLAGVGTPATLATQVAATAVGYRPVVVARYFPPVCYPSVVVSAPLVAPAPVVVPRAVYYGPRYYRSFMFAPVVVPGPYVSYGVIY
jgi:hypothetical protein